MRQMARLSRTALAALALLTTAGCGTDGGDGDGGAAASGGTTLTVYAASSLTSSFEELAREFEQANDGVDVELALAGSSDLVSQIQNGAPADVFASADEANMDTLVADGLVGSDPELFATNVLEIAVPPDNPADVQSLKDLAEPGLALVVCAPEVPCGAAAQRVTETAGVQVQPVSEEQSVTDVLAKVTSGEADAGLVYVTDVIAAGDEVQGIEFPEATSVVNNYPIATVADSENPDLAQAFVDLVLGQDGQRVLTDAGFGRP